MIYEYIRRTEPDCKHCAADRHDSEYKKIAVLNFGEINSYFLSIPNISPGQVTGSELTEGTPV